MTNSIDGSNSFIRFDILYFSVDYLWHFNSVFPSRSSSQNKPFAIGLGFYCLSSVLSFHTNAGLQVPLIFTFDIDNDIFDIYFKIAPGIGFDVSQLSFSFNWNFFAGIGIRFCIL